MSIRSPRRHLAGFVLAALLTPVVVGCSGAAGSASPSLDLGSGARSAPATSTEPGALIDTDALLAAAPGMDGQPVRVSGFFLATGDSAQLCSVVMESYPPQCGGSTLRLTGQIPADVLDGLDKTTEPGLNQATWGWVNVTGTFRASGSDGRPVIEISQIELDDSGA